MAVDRPAVWNVVIAAILDFFLVFIGGGYVIAKQTGNTTEAGFHLNAMPALVLFALVFVYFIGAKRVGGTVFRRLFGIA